MSENTESLDLWKIPYHEPPPGVTSDFGARSDLLDPTIVIVSLVLFTTTCIIALRIWANWGRGKWQIDDWCAIATFILTITNGGMLIPLTRVFGKQDYDIPVGLLRYSRWFQRMLSIYGFVLSFAILLGKCCMLALYYRLFSIRKSMRIQIYIALIFCLPIAAGGIAFIIEFGPEKSYEDMRRRREKREWLPMISAAACLVVDALIVVMPIPVILGLNLSTRRKRGVLAMFATGSIAVVADIVVIYLRVLVLQRNGLGRHFIMTALFG
ncbi:hypothetical protein FB567DRAFT_588407 [Paraphoma chrysanthemicola]|uniref:Rhodopsin domain-containing protein n=1 Tax=Paraphoma chrysanthemicola TaxID=798071 RepID=A0A8K0RG94_9PLEO|nr:hypothetical protein FB567DRAFT_588407 [Paraphoma chrysanthemicola]